MIVFSINCKHAERDTKFSKTPYFDSFQTQRQASVAQPQSTHPAPATTAPPPGGSEWNQGEDEDDEDFSKRTERLQMEAKIALAQVRLKFQSVLSGNATKLLD